MIETHTVNGETWVDMDEGTPEEIHSLVHTYGVHPFVARELSSATPKPRVEFHEHYIYCVLHFPVWRHTHSKEKNEDRNQEVDFIIGKDTLITARYDTIDALYTLSKELNVKEVLGKDGPRKEDSQTIFIWMLRRLYGDIFDELEAIEDNIEDITGNIFKNKEREMVVSISEISRTLLDFKRVIDMHREILESVRAKGEEMFGEKFAAGMDTVFLDYNKINTAIKSNMEMLGELRQTDNSLLTAKQNETMKWLAFVGAVLVILSILITLYR